MHLIFGLQLVSEVAGAVGAEYNFCHIERLPSVLKAVLRKQAVLFVPKPGRQVYIVMMRILKALDLRPKPIYLFLTKTP